MFIFCIYILSGTASQPKFRSKLETQLSFNIPEARERVLNSLNFFLHYKLLEKIVEQMHN